MSPDQPVPITTATTTATRSNTRKRKNRSGSSSLLTSDNHFTPEQHQHHQQEVIDPPAFRPSRPQQRSQEAEDDDDDEVEKGGAGNHHHHHHHDDENEQDHEAQHEEETHTHLRVIVKEEKSRQEETALVVEPHDHTHGPLSPVPPLDGKNGAATGGSEMVTAANLAPTLDNKEEKRNTVRWWQLEWIQPSPWRRDRASGAPLDDNQGTDGDPEEPTALLTVPAEEPPGGTPSSPATIPTTTTTTTTTTTSRWICLQGRGYLSDDDDDHHLERQHVHIHGYPLKKKKIKHPDDDDELDEEVYFECPPWTAGLCVALPPGSRVRIRSDPRYRDPRSATRHHPISTTPRQPSFSVQDARSPGPARPTVIPPSWTAAAQDILADWQASGDAEIPTSSWSSTSSFQVVVAGAKGVGKSTCLRYLLNRWLPHCPQGIALLDADVGQPELSPPGVMSLHIVHHPLLVPPHVHLMPSSSNTTSRPGSRPRRRHVRSFYFGAVTSQTDPNRYLECIRRLRDAYEQDLSSAPPPSHRAKIPLLVNLDGWVKGLGLQVLEAILWAGPYLQPRHIVQLSGDLKAKSLDLSSHPLATSGAEVVHLPLGGGASRGPAYSLYPRLHGCRAFNSIHQREAHGHDEAPSGASFLTATPPIPSSIPAASLRAMRLVSYFMSGLLPPVASAKPQSHLDNTPLWDRLGFGQSHDDGIDDPDLLVARTLAAARPYVVPMESVHCAFCCVEDQMDIVREDLVWDALNGSMVGLCCRGPMMSANDSPMEYSPCVGLGLVRSIDRQRRLFYILTPVSVQELTQVDTLLCGRIPLPRVFWIRGDQAEAFPYVSFPDEINLQGKKKDASKMMILGSEPMKSRNNIARKGGPK